MTFAQVNFLFISFVSLNEWRNINPVKCEQEQSNWILRWFVRLLGFFYSVDSGHPFADFRLCVECVYKKIYSNRVRIKFFTMFYPLLWFVRDENFEISELYKLKTHTRAVVSPHVLKVSPLFSLLLHLSHQIKPKRIF